MRLAALVAGGLVLAALGCGNKGAVIAPELVSPEPPTDLAASPTPDGVRLTWTRPTKYTGGQRMRDLGSFIIERAVVADASPLEFQRVGTIELQDQTRFRQDRRLEYTDTSVVADHEYVYRVRARTVDGYDSPWSGPAKARGKAP
jgi:hypothetical protein